MFNLNFISIIIFLVFISKSIGFVKFEVDNRNFFPYPANKSFSILFTPSDRFSAFNLNFYDTMVISIVSSEIGRIVLDKSIFDYGFKENIDYPYRSDYMVIPYWIRKNKINTINVTILFSRRANGNWLEVHQIQAKTNRDRNILLQNLSHAHRLMREQVNLLIPPRLELKIISPDGRKNELKPQELGSATCRSFDGIPPVEPIFYGLSDLDVKKNQFIANMNERKIQFSVSIFDHEKILRCRARESEIKSIILVLHHPTHVTLDPEPGPFFENGSSIACLKADGYPLPITWWTFVSGPTNASLFFKLSEGSIKFHLSKNAPLQSHWTLNCSASNVIPGSFAVYNRTITFIVGRSQDVLLDKYNLTSQIIIGIVVAWFIALFCFLIIIIICIVRICYVHGAPVNAGRKKGTSNKTLFKEKALFNM